MKKIINIRIFLSLFIVFFNSMLFASYQEALSLYEAGKYNDSLKIIANELDISKDFEVDSPNYNLRYLAAHNHWKLGNLESALIHFKKCAEIKKDIPDPLIDLSLLMLDFKRYGDARYFSDRALKIIEGPVPYYVLGQVSVAYGNYYEAKVYFEKAISLNPEFGTSYNALGIVLMRLRKYGEANTAFSAAMAILPDSDEVLNNIALNLEKTGKFDEAFEYIQKAYEINPADPVIQANVKQIKEMISSSVTE